MNPDLVEHIKSNHINNFEEDPLMVFSPGRINLIGEHTDYNDGFVLPAAIDKGIVIGLSKTASNLSTIVALDINEEFSFSIENIEPIKDGGWRNYVIGVVAEIQKKGCQIGNFNLLFGGDIPIGAGLSSSAALENSIVFGLSQLFELILSKKEMILISQRAEHNFVGVTCGIMDQYASMFGQKDSAILLDCQNLNSSLIDLDLGNYEILLINTNVKHSLAESAYNERRSTCERVAAVLNIKSLRDATQSKIDSIMDQISDDDCQKSLYVIQENQRVLEAAKAIRNKNIDALGALFYASHHGLQHQYKVSCEELDFLVDQTRGVDSIIGSRMMGGGFGGCTINLIRKDSLQSCKAEIALAYSEKFNNDCSFYKVRLSAGTRLIEAK